MGVSDNRDRVGMSPLVAASLVKEAGVEPILYVVTRDRNRIALVSDFLGAHALGIRNVLCTTGTHQTLGRPRAAKNVFDLDSIQLLRSFADLATDGRFVGEESIKGCRPVCLGGVASAVADPLELQVLRLVKKAAAGARFLITDPVFDLDRFTCWWKQVAERGLPQRVAFLAGVRVLTDAKAAEDYAQSRPDPRIPDALLERIVSATSASAARAAGIDAATETVKRLSETEGLRGFQIRADGDDDAALEVMEKTGWGAD
jgi:methylenetetrahydrofolate reductase (NADPH)